MSPPSERVHVMAKAKAYADALRDDPVMASQLREHFSVEDLLHRLRITEDDVIDAFGWRQETRHDD